MPACTVASGCCARHPRACTEVGHGSRASTSAVRGRQARHFSSSHRAKAANATALYASCALSIAQGLRDGQLPWSALNGVARGIDGQLHVPKRNWARGGVSGSVSRSMQHSFMWQYVSGDAGVRPPRGRCLDWDGWYGGSIFSSLCSEVDVLVYARVRASARRPTATAGHEQSLSATAGHEQSLSATSGQQRSLSATAGQQRSLSATAGHEQSLSATAGQQRSLSATAGHERSLSATAGHERSTSATECL